MALVVSLVWSVFGMFVAIAAGLIWCRVRPHSRFACRFLVTVVIGYALTSSWLFAAGAARVLTLGLNPPVLSGSPDRTAIVLLAASATIVEDWSGTHLETLSVHGASRVLEASRVYRQFPDAVIISSGGPPDDPRGVSADSILMRDALVRLGVPEARIHLESASRNTHEQAVLIAPILQQLKPARVIVVTSAVHMRRSLGVFRAQGIDVEASMAKDPFLPMGWFYRIVPSSAGLAASGAIAHEVFGLAYYATRGWL